MPGTTRIPPLVGALALGIALVGAACSSNGGQSAPNSVSMVDYSFSPGSMTVASGTTVTWKNGGTQDHTVTADDASFDSGHVAVGSTFTRTFSAAGTFTYHCTIHHQMTGTIIVTP
jgi:plastocyanin